MEEFRKFERILPLQYLPDEDGKEDIAIVGCCCSVGGVIAH